ncbi:cyclopropane-fatty-acyl-phospholipid synthase family protein [Sulfuritalea sp.]|uniref:SAM-dependent methyltransferase n=1 Tax=Sulfuritalea sp. TaxID=2480090 RepID=UPI001AD60255|nr:cyclopropane-fatty-acyl-phospholipid synthase family protein [Sulfuritalea sp.]MBN8475394.1 class I SAM-dependent methyltransferase [Sulfuritalea sp.]
MNTLVSNSLPLSRQRPAAVPSALAPATRTAIKLLQNIEGGSLRLILPDGQHIMLGHGAERATLEVNDERVFRRVLAEGDIGFGESWIAGDWHSDHPAELLTLLAENRAQLARAVHGSWLPVLGHRLRHLLRSNTRAGSKRNILAHYDLGNDFYKLWLDPSMSYSSALFGTDPQQSLQQAQRQKYLRLLEMLEPKPGDTILEVGCGWGGLAEIATTEFGCRVHGITLSPSQLEWSRARAQQKGFADLADFSLTDYRDVRGRYDHIVSIEMFEAVGERFWPGYFAQLNNCLKPGGRAAVQTITIANERFGAYRRGTDFIQRHIFPGGMLPSPAVFERRAASADFSVLDRHAFGIDYTRTLAHWHGDFEAAWPQIAVQGFDERFRRLWRFYLAYCEAGFRSGAIDVYHFLLEKPRA